MSIPALLLCVILATLYGAAFHLWRGGGPGRLLLYLILAWAGFAAGQYLGMHFKVTFGRVGFVHAVLGTLFSFIFLGIGYWLSLVQVEKTK